MNLTEDFSENQNLTVVEGEVVGFSGPDVNFTLNCTGTDDAQTKNIFFSPERHKLYFCSSKIIFIANSSKFLNKNCTSWDSN